MESTPAVAARRRAMRVAVRLGVVMLASGAQTREVETSLRRMLGALGLPGAEVVVTYSTVSVSFIAPGDAEATTAIGDVRRWQPDYNRLAGAAALVRAIGDGRSDLRAAEAELERVEASTDPYPRWLGFAAPALLSMAVTILFGGRVVDALATLGIGLAIQPALERIERSQLPSFFQVVFGAAATALLVVLLVKLGLPIQGSLVLTGSLLRFLPGTALVSGMHDLIDGALMSGTGRLAEVALLGAAIAGAASLVLAFGATLGVRLQITSAGRVDWPALVLVAAGFVAVAFYACRLGVPRRALWLAATLGAIAVVLTRGLTPLSADLSRSARTLLAALVIGIVGTMLAHRSQAPAALWMVPAILPLLPAPSTLLPALAQTEPARQALQGLAAETAFLIGVGVASGSILVETFQRYRARALQPVVGVVSDGLSAHVVRPIRTWGRRNWRRANPAADGNDAEHGRPPG
jgi:uncharacterized membrane protein YjjP (DUF1212 family)